RGIAADRRNDRHAPRPRQALNASRRADAPRPIGSCAGRPTMSADRGPRFFQAPPTLGNQYLGDRVLRSYLKRALSPDMLASIEPALATMGDLSGGRLYEMQLADRANEPSLVQWDAWGHRIDRIEVSPLWKEAARLAAEHGVVAAAYERAHGELSRVH